MGRKDSFWEHVEELPGIKFKCTYCKRTFSGGIVRVKSHLSGIRGREIDVCNHVPKDVQTKAILSIGGANKKARTTLSDASNEVDNTTSQSSLSFPSGGLQQCSIQDEIKKMDKGDIDQRLAKCFILNNMAFNIVQTPSFIDFVKSVIEFGPTYKLPSYSTLRAKLVPELRMKVEEYISYVKITWIRTGCTLMADIWSDIKQRSFIIIIGYSPGGAVMLKSVEISNQKNIGYFIYQLLVDVIESIGAEHVVQFISGNASNLEYASERLIGRFQGLYKTKCGAHGIQLLLKDIYEDPLVQWVRHVIDDAKHVQSYMYHHTLITTMMRESTKGKELKRPCATRVTSNFLVLQSLLQVEGELRLLIASSQWRNHELNRQPTAIKVTDIIQNMKFWAQANEVMQILEPLVLVLRLVDGDGSTAGYLYKALERAKEVLKQRCQTNGAKYGRIFELFERRRSENIIHPIHAAAAFLNPAYLLSDEFTETHEMKNGISFMLTNVVKEDEREAFIIQVQRYRSKSPDLFNTSSLIMLKTSHPRLWWDYCGDCFPILQKYAIRVLSQPCSSSSCKRNWSAWEAAQTKKRNKLSPKMLDTLVYVRMNTMMMENFATKVQQDLKPIDFKNICKLPEDDFEDEGEDAIEDTDATSPREMGCPILHKFMV